MYYKIGCYNKRLLGVQILATTMDFILMETLQNYPGEAAGAQLSYAKNYRTVNSAPDSGHYQTQAFRAQKIYLPVGKINRALLSSISLFNCYSSFLIAQIISRFFGLRLSRTFDLT